MEPIPTFFIGNQTGPLFRASPGVDLGGFFGEALQRCAGACDVLGSLGLGASEIRV